jgi:diguanylate cyclase (GGDEF)-like protein
MEDRKRVRAWAGVSRLVFGTLALGVFPAIHPGLERAQPVFGLYLLIALTFQILIVLDIGDRPRAISGNVVDTLAITYMVQQIGSTTTAFAALYVFAAVVNTLAVGRRVGITAAIVASIAYGGVLACETLGIIPYAPAARTVTLPPPALEAIAVWFVMTLQLVLSAQIVGALVGLIKDRELALRQANEKLDSLARRDPLTDLWNRRHLMECLKVSLAAGSDLSVVMIDLDGFKRVNDTLGHVKGDELLTTLARALEDDVARGGTVFRVGGDEFLIMLSLDAARAAAYGERVVQCVRESSRAFSSDCHVTASVGLAGAEPGDTFESIVRRADDRAYEAKRAGGDRMIDA